jgi:hypothetical protein
MKRSTLYRAVRVSLTEFCWHAIAYGDIADCTVRGTPGSNYSFVVFARPLPAVITSASEHHFHCALWQKRSSSCKEQPRSGRATHQLKQTAAYVQSIEQTMRIVRSAAETTPLTRAETRKGKTLRGQPFGHIRFFLHAFTLVPLFASGCPPKERFYSALKILIAGLRGLFHSPGHPCAVSDDRLKLRAFSQRFCSFLPQDVRRRRASPRIPR